MTLSEKSAYLKGLMEGMQLSTETDEGKMIAALVDTIGQIASSISDLEENAIAVSDELDEIEETLDAMEDFLLDEFDEDDEDDEEEEDEEDDEEEPMFFEVTCPTCEKTITVDEDVLALGSIQCPNCGEMMEFEFDEDEAEPEE